MQPFPDGVPKRGLSLLPSEGMGAEDNKQEKNMKISIRHCGTAALIAGALLLSPMAFGQDTVTTTSAAPDAAVTQTTTTSSDGTITEFSPGDSVVLRTETSSAPVRYVYNKTTTVVDESGNPVDVSVVKTGVPVHVFYAQEGGQMIARKIVVEQATTPAQPDATIIKKTTTTTTTANPQ
jgi:hypothetical protein